MIGEQICIDVEGTAIYEKYGYIGVDGKQAFDCFWNDRQAAGKNEKEMEILLVKCSYQKKKCSERNSCQYRKTVLAVVFSVHFSTVLIFRLRQCCHYLFQGFMHTF